MGMFLLILFVVFVAVPIFRVWTTLRRARKSYRSFFDAASRQASGYRSEEEPPQQPPSRRKIYARDEGEYVDFQEVEVTASTTATEQALGCEHTVVEQQITDVEWEEIS